MPDKPAYYWDSCVSLSYINEMPKRLSNLNALLERSFKGEIRLFTSEFSRVEVAFSATEKGEKTLDAETERRIDGLWVDPDVITMVEYHRGISLEARRLIRLAMTRGWSLQPFDAVHLATAQWLSNTGITIDEFHTYDRRLFKYGSIVGFKIMKPITAQPSLI